jgi:cyclopropane fatty-acyl-phospholipid synthase-like methyltransferase
MLKLESDKERLKTTKANYVFWNKIFLAIELTDYTEGMFNGDPDTPIDVAQLNQINYVLDEVECGKGVRILEVGCGNGHLLEEIRKRGANGIGITISPEEVAFCKQRGLDVRLLNYRDIDDEWTHQFDAVIANGSVEHFVQAKEASQNLDDAIYRNYFEICRRVINPKSSIKKMMNTTIFFVRKPDPRNLLKSPFAFSWGSDNFHWSMLTYDYHLTSEHWLRRVKKAFTDFRELPKFIRAFLSVLIRNPVHTLTMTACCMVTQSWEWQFRPPNPRAKLLRQTWKYRDY